MLGEVDAHFSSDYLDEPTVLALARAKATQPRQSVHRQPCH